MSSNSIDPRDMGQEEDWQYQLAQDEPFLRMVAEEEERPVQCKCCEAVYPARLINERSGECFFCEYSDHIVNDLTL